MVREQMASLEAVLAAISGRADPFSEQLRLQSQAELQQLRHTITDLKPRREQIMTLETHVRRRHTGITEISEKLRIDQLNLDQMVQDLSVAEMKLQKLMQDQSDADLQEAMTASFRSAPMDLAGLKACVDPSLDSPEDIAKAQALFQRLEGRLLQKTKDSLVAKARETYDIGAPSSMGFTDPYQVNPSDTADVSEARVHLLVSMVLLLRISGLWSQY